MMAIFEILSIICLCAVCCYYYYAFKFDFWQKRKVIGPKPVLFFGTIKDVMLQRISFMEHYKKMYIAYKDVPLVGTFNQTTPILMINDFSLIKDVFTNTEVFSGRGVKYFKKAEPTTYNLFFMKGKVPLQLRTKLSSIFTPNKLKTMFSLLLQRTEIFNNWLDTLLSQNEEVNCKQIMKRLFSDYTATCIFNYDLTIEDSNSKVFHYIRSFSNIKSLKNVLKLLLLDFSICNKLYDLIGYHLFDNREMTEFFNHFVNNIISYRKKHHIFKHDIVNVFMELKQNKLIENFEFTDDFFMSNMMMIFLGGYETSAATICNAMYELALNHIIQNRLREEIRSLFAKNNGELTFEDVMAMPYLDAVFKETLRKYPLSDIILRQSSTPYTFKNTKVTIPKDQIIIVPVSGIHFNPEIYPEPEIYDPERFIGEGAPSKQTMHFIPFGYGPRNCIGERFGTLQVKTGLINIVRNYKIDICEKTQKIYSDELFVQQLKDMYLKLIKIN